MPVAGAVVGGAIISARASSSAAKTGAAAADRSAAQIAAAGKQAREDVLQFFPGAQQDLLAGAEGAFNILGGGVGAQQRALSQGSLAAQGTLGGGFSQIQNALLGLPVNTQGFAPQGIDFTQVPQNPFAPQAPSGVVDSQAQATGLVDGVATGPGFVTAPGLAPRQGGFTDLSSQIQQREFERTAPGQRDLSDLIAQANPTGLGRKGARQSGAFERRDQAVTLLASLGFDKNGNPLGV